MPDNFEEKSNAHQGKSPEWAAVALESPLSRRDQTLFPFSCAERLIYMETAAE